MDDLVERLRAGVRPIGLDDDNSTELFNIIEADETMAEAAKTIAQLEAKLVKARDEGDQLQGFMMEAIERIEKGDLDERMCCDGHMCACQGSTNADQFLHFAKAALAEIGQ